MDEMLLLFHVCLGEREVVIGVYAGSYYPLVAGRAAVSTPPPLHCLLRGVLKSLREFIQKFESFKSNWTNRSAPRRRTWSQKGLKIGITLPVIWLEGINLVWMSHELNFPVLKLNLLCTPGLLCVCLVSLRCLCLCSLSRSLSNVCEHLCRATPLSYPLGWLHTPPSIYVLHTHTHTYTHTRARTASCNLISLNITPPARLVKSPFTSSMSINKVWKPADH